MPKRNATNRVAGARDGRLTVINRFGSVASKLGSKAVQPREIT